MKLEEYVTSYDLSKAISRLGKFDDTLFAWIEKDDEKRVVINYLNLDDKKIPAFTAHELIEMLPKFVGDASLQIKTLKNGFAVSYPGTRKPICTGALESALGLMLAHLEENL